MERPRILATGKYKPSDLQIVVSESTRKIQPQVENKLEAIWQAKVKKAEEKGQVCYNGISYRLNSLKEEGGQLILNLGTLEYKVRDSLTAIPEYFDLSEEYFRKGCFTSASIKTSDNLYLMAELTGKSMNPNSIDLIGGIMETDIDMEIGNDVFKSLYKELEEEAGITQKDINECYLQTIYLEYKTNVAFYFEVILNVTAEELVERFKNNKDGDIKSLRVFTREEYINVLNHHPRINKQFTAKLLQI